MRKLTVGVAGGIAAIAMAFGGMALAAAPSFAGTEKTGTQYCAGGPSVYAGISGHFASYQLDFTSTLNGNHERIIDPSWDYDHPAIYSAYTSTNWILAALDFGDVHGICS
jgi:hypothetical protein